MRNQGTTKALLQCGTALAGVAGVLMLAGITSRTAHAVPSYGYAEVDFTHFTLTGIVNGSGVLDSGVSGLTDSVLITDGANYPPASSGGFSANGTLTGGADATEATAGPGPFPGQNVFTQQMTAASGTRGDGLITGAIATGATSNMVSEGNLTTGPGSAGSNAGSSTTLTATFTVTAPTTIGLSFFAAVQLLASVGDTGDSATALTSAAFSVEDLTTHKFVSICDLVNTGCTTAGSSMTGAQVDPGPLNNSIGTTTPGAPASFSSPSTFYSYSAALTAPGQYRVVLGDSTQDILSTAVPEPVSLALLGTGMMGIGVIRRRRRS